MFIVLFFDCFLIFLLIPHSFQPSLVHFLIPGECRVPFLLLYSFSFYVSSVFHFLEAHFSCHFLFLQLIPLPFRSFLFHNHSNSLLLISLPMLLILFPCSSFSSVPYFRLPLQVIFFSPCRSSSRPLSLIFLSPHPSFFSPLSPIFSCPLSLIFLSLIPRFPVPYPLFFCPQSLLFFPSWSSFSSPLGTRFPLLLELVSLSDQSLSLCFLDCFFVSVSFLLSGVPICMFFSNIKMQINITDRHPSLSNVDYSYRKGG